MTTYNNVLGVFSYAAHTLANTLWSERAFRGIIRNNQTIMISSDLNIRNVKRLHCLNFVVGYMYMRLAYGNLSFFLSFFLSKSFARILILIEI